MSDTVVHICVDATFADFFTDFSSVVRRPLFVFFILPLRGGHNVDNSLSCLGLLADW